MSSPEPPLRDELVAFTNDAPERTRDRLASGRAEPAARPRRWSAGGPHGHSRIDRHALGSIYLEQRDTMGALPALATEHCGRVRMT